MEPSKKDNAPIGRKFIEKTVPSAIPLWGAAAFWLIAALFLPMYSIWHILLYAVLSAAIGIALHLILPKETRQVEVPVATGDVKVDEAVKEINRVIDSLRETSTKIHGQKPSMAEQLERICETLEKIRDDLIHSPDDLKSCRRLLNYYLPTTVQLANRYETLLHQDEQSENVKSTMESVEKALEQVETGYQHQYNALFEDDAMDASADVSVLETILKQDNLTK